MNSRTWTVALTHMNVLVAKWKTVVFFDEPLTHTHITQLWISLSNNSHKLTSNIQCIHINSLSEIGKGLSSDSSSSSVWRRRGVMRVTDTQYAQHWQCNLSQNLTITLWLRRQSLMIWQTIISTIAPRNTYAHKHTQTHNPPTDCAWVINHPVHNTSSATVY